MGVEVRCEKCGKCTNSAEAYTKCPDCGRKYKVAVVVQPVEQAAEVVTPAE